MKTKHLWIGCLMVLFARPANADTRAFVWTYEYQTMPAGRVELETYYTLSAPDLDTPRGETFTEQQVEIEIGMTDRFDFAVYQVFAQAPEEALVSEGIKLRARYRLGEAGEYPLDPLIYFEYIGGGDLTSQAIEAKLVLAKTSGPYTASTNWIIEVEEEEPAEWETKLEYSAGVGYRIERLLTLGLEARGGADGHYLGPVISHGTEKAWVALGSAVRLMPVEEGEPEFQVRMILGVML